MSGSIHDSVPVLSVVLPVYNEAGNLHELYRRLTQTLTVMVVSYELIFVDDGSQDNSLDTLHTLHQQDSRVHILRLSRNFGHHIALTAGMEHASGEYVVLMDSDLQDQPEEIPKLWDTLHLGYDMVYGDRQNLQFSWHKRWLSRSFRWVMQRVLGYEIQGGVFRILRRCVVDAILRCHEPDRMLVGLIRWVGFRQTGVPVEHGARYTGHSHYSLRKQWQLATHAITAFSSLPLRVAFWLGTLCLLACLTGMLWLFVRPHHAPNSLSGWYIVFLLILLLSGLQFLCIGVIGTYLSRTFTASRQRPLYIVDPRSSTPPRSIQKSSLSSR